MPAKITLSVSEKEFWREMFYSDFGTKVLAKQTGRDMYKTIRPFWIAEFGANALKERCSRLNRLHKVGAKNPMFGRCKEQHPLHKEQIVTTQGYRFVEKPSWYKGKSKNNKVAEHIIVYCAANDIVVLPYGFVVHHKDGNKLNNTPFNLELLSISEHMRLHDNFRKGATTRAKARSFQEDSETQSISDGTEMVI